MYMYLLILLLFHLLSIAWLKIMRLIPLLNSNLVHLVYNFNSVDFSVVCLTVRNNNSNNKDIFTLPTYHKVNILQMIF